MKTLGVIVILALAARSIYAAQCKHFTTTTEQFIWYEEVRGSHTEFNVKTEHDAVVKLYIDPPPHSNSLNHYDIVIGGSGNTVVSATNMGHPVTTANVAGSFLNPDQYITFWIRKEAGLVQVGDTHNATAFLKLQDPEVIPVNYFTVSSIDNNIAYWEYVPDGVNCVDITTIGDVESVSYGLKAVGGTDAKLDFQVALTAPAQNIYIQMAERSYPSSLASTIIIEIAGGSTTSIYWGTKVLSTTSTPGIVSHLQVTDLWAEVTDTEVLLGLRSSPDVPVARANLTTPIDVMYYSLSGGTNANEVVWLVNCVTPPS